MEESGQKNNTHRVRYSFKDDFTGDRVYISFRDKSAIKELINKAKEEIVSRKMIVPIEETVMSAEYEDIDWSNPKNSREAIRHILKKVLGKDVTLGVENKVLTARLTREGLNHATKKGNNSIKGSIFQKFVEIANSSVYSFSTIHDNNHSNASQTVQHNVSWDNFVAVVEVNDNILIPVVFVVRSIDTDLRSQIYDAWIKNEVKATHEAGTQIKSVNSHSNYDGQLTSKNSVPQSSENSNIFDGKKSKNDIIDSDYLSAVERGDMETAQRMVDIATFFIAIVLFLC